MLHLEMPRDATWCNCTENQYTSFSIFSERILFGVLFLLYQLTCAVLRLRKHKQKSLEGCLLHSPDTRKRAMPQKPRSASPIVYYLSGTRCPKRQS